MVCKLHERNKIKSQSHWVILIPANTFLSIANISNHKKILNLKRLMLYVLTKARWQMYISCCTDWCELAFVICPPQSKCGTDMKVQSSDMCRLNHNDLHSKNWTNNLRIIITIQLTWLPAAWNPHDCIKQTPSSNPCLTSLAVGRSGSLAPYPLRWQ